jgi:glycosyltransferase involved in cell wall biosynthesis
MPKVSVILPIYNAGSYLEPCLESIRVQTLEDFEVLCVNDGSKDDSLATMQKFADMDARFKVLDKPNGGYGHSLNYGLAHATGEYIAIVEPDDFIDPDMYRDLYGYAHVDGTADVVKGSYWEYFDGRDGFEEEIREPNISRCMPKTAHAFTLDEYAEVFCHHPSIWSAIYRRAFLEEQGIRFVEPKGAGWADNPFFVETLVSASRIVWVPKAYYFYRQTNPSASSFLKDFHIPFDRAREMRKILADHQVSNDILAAFYLREFDYIFSVIGEFGFDAIDLEIRTLIQEVLDSMDPDIVHTNPKLRHKDVKLYDNFNEYHLATVQLTDGVFRASIDRDAQPKISYILPITLDGGWIERSLKCLCELEQPASEIICVNCGSTDQSLLITHVAAELDARVICLERDFGSVPAGINAAMEQATGEYLFVWSPDTAVDNRFLKAVDAALAEQPDVFLIDHDMRFSVDVMRVMGEAYALDDARVQSSPNAIDSYISKPLDPKDLASFVFNCSAPNFRTAFYKANFLRENGLTFADADVCGDGSFTVRSVLQAETVVYAAMSCFIQLDDEPRIMPFYLDLHDELQIEEPLCITGALDVWNGLAKEMPSAYATSLKNFVLDSFMVDLGRRPSYQSMSSYVKTYLSKVREIIGDDFTGRVAHVDSCFNAYQMLRLFGLSGFLADRSLQSSIDIAWLKRELDNLYVSPTMRVGRKVNRMVRMVLPDKLLGSLKASMGGSEER